MKTTIRLPLGQFEFIEMTYDTQMTPEAAVEAFNALQKAYKGGDGISDKDMDMMVKNMCLGSTIVGGTELYATATPTQQKELQRLKRILKQLRNNKQEEPEID